MPLFSNGRNELFNCNLSFTTNAHDDDIRDFENYMTGSQCRKKELHSKFIPFNKIDLEHFDNPFKQQDIIDLTKALGNLVVKLELNKTDPERPSNFPKNPTCGTGRITFCKVKKGTRFWHCMCQVCEHSRRPKTEWAEISVATAAHVVSGQLEAENSTCILRYNKKHSANTVTFEGLKVVDVNVEHDRSHVIYITHDMELAKCLRRSIYLFQTKHKRLYKLYKDSKENNLAILVSHPHGWHKHVSIGTYNREVIDQENSENNDIVFTTYLHSAHSCPGSSGAPLYLLGKEDVWYMHPHSGANYDLGKSSKAYERV